jgi:iron complex outermembrane receptor protein
MLPEVSVSATRIERENRELPVSIDTVGQRVIREDNPQVNLSEALNRVPGVTVQNRQNYAQDLQISTRGFGGRSTFGVRGVRLIADGIPASMPDGQGQAATFSLGSAERIEVMRGPFSSLYGNAAGGVIQIFTADGPREPTASSPEATTRSSSGRSSPGRAARSTI